VVFHFVSVALVIQCCAPQVPDVAYSVMSQGGFKTLTYVNYVARTLHVGQATRRGSSKGKEAISKCHRWLWWMGVEAEELDSETKCKENGSVR
jgi:hypothetical protein